METEGFPPPPSLEDSVRDDLAKKLKEKNMQFRYKAVEDVMAPLIHRVTSLTEFKPASEDGSTGPEATLSLHRRHFGSPQKLVQLVDKAVMNFVAVGEDIATENPEFQEELLATCEEIRSRGESLHAAGSVFIQDTCQTDKRVVMVRAARELLFSITRLMVIADVVDVNNLLNASSKIEEKLRSLQNARNEGELIEKVQDCTTSIAQITQTATLRLKETKSKISLQLLAAAQTELNQASIMLVSASKAFLHTPTVKAAEENRDFIIEGMLKSLKTLSLLADGEDPLTIDTETGKMEPGELVASFANLESSLDQISPGGHIPPQVSASLQKELEVILKAAADLAVSSCTRDYRQHTVISQSSALKESLQGLVSSCDSNSGGEGDSEDDESTRESVGRTRKYSATLKQELYRVSVDHLSDAFIGVFTPLNALIKAAQEGERNQVERKAEEFELHSRTMLKAASMLCSLSRDVDGIQMVKMAAKHVRILIPQVTCAARTLVAQPKSGILQKNMSVFREGWVENVTLLTSSVDAIAPLLDFLVVTESHLHEDSQALTQAVGAGDRAGFEQAVYLMRGRCGRVAHIVKTEMRENPAHYSDEKRDRISGRTHELESKSLMAFHDTVFKVRDKFDDIHNEVECQRELKDASEKVMDDVRNLCREFLETRSLTAEGKDMQSDLVEDTSHPPRSVTSTPSLLSEVSSTTSLDSSVLTPKKFERTPQHSQVFDAKDSAKIMMTQLSPEQQAQLAKVTADLSAQQAEFENAAQKWDSDNDIVVLAKEMCMMMMNMSDFTRGIGPLHTIMDLVITAKDIARAGEGLSVLARAIADQCLDKKSKNDLFAYVDRIKLHCHQLKITSAVKSDAKTSSRETVDSASALIIAAKNLMTAVVETVKTSYIASVAIARLHGGSMPDQFTQWRLTMPRQKSLEFSPDVRKDAPIHQLGQFKPDRPKKTSHLI